LTRKITICFKKRTQISKRLNIPPTKNKYVISIQNMRGGEIIMRTAIFKIFLSFTSLERPLLRTSSARQKSKGDTKEKNPPNYHLFL